MIIKEAIMNVLRELLVSVIDGLGRISLETQCNAVLNSSRALDVKSSDRGSKGGRTAHNGKGNK